VARSKGMALTEQQRLVLLLEEALRTLEEVD
jgi:hypothetical protein